jgi:hypothetical protein
LKKTILKMEESNSNTLKEKRNYLEGATWMSNLL